jgi:beta-lactam-binding protein with PASTA domain
MVMRPGVRVAMIVCSALAFTSCSAGHVAVPRSATNAYPAQATAALCNAGLQPIYLTAPTLRHADIGLHGYAVRSISPAPGSEVKAGSVVTVRLILSANGGPGWSGTRPRSVVPNVNGLDANKALGEITTLGLFGTLIATTPTGALTVTGETPSAGTTVRGGSTVVLHIGKVGSQGCQ